MFARKWLEAFCLAPLLWTLVPIQTASAAAATSTPAASTQFLAAMQSAANSRHVPLSVVEATAYVNTRWEWIGTPQMDRSVGPMRVRPSDLALASSISGRSQSQITSDLASNLDAGAALMARHHTSGSDLGSWQAAVAGTQGPVVATQIFETMRDGATRTTSSGESITLPPQALSISASRSPASAAAAATDFSSALWIPADPSNYSVANRAHDHPIDMIIVHDIEGSTASAIQLFQTPNFAASANYVVSYGGQITQMVREHDIAWHAGNWDYNTRAIGIEHEGFAYTPGLYTTAEYNASAALAASICSRWGVPMDRTHVIGHYEVPDPNNPGLFGGVDHHTDPGPYWDWSYYMTTAQADAAALPSPPHLMPDPVATNGLTSATITWQPARTCHRPISGYTVTGQPGNLSMTLPATATSATFNNLQVGTRYTYTVTAINADGQDSQTTNPVIAGACTNAGLSASPASPQNNGTAIQLTATSATCANPLYEFWMLPPGGVWTDVQPYSFVSTFNWATARLVSGTYSFALWARDTSSPGNFSDSAGTFDARFGLDYTLTPAPCSATNIVVSPSGSAMAGTAVTLTAGATGCSNPLFEFWLQSPSGAWGVVQAYSTNATFNWNTAGQAAGSYRFSVWTRTTGGVGLNGTSPNTYDSFSAFPYVLTTGCASMTATAAPASTAMAGATVTITASASGCPHPLYQVYVLPPGGAWTLVQPYSPAATYAWNSAGAPAGSYRFSVWARDAGSASAYDAFSAFQYTLTTTSCSAMSASAAPPTSASVGTTVTVTGSATGCPSPLYQFWLLPPGGTWYVARAYSTGNTLSWNTAGLAAGSYRFSVWARDASSASAYDAFSAFQYGLTISPCTGMSASAAPPATATRGTTVTITASASGCPNALYEFWMLPPGGTWTLVKAYSTSATLTWNSTNQPAGSYRFSVWARDAGSSGTSGTPPYTYDAFSAFQYTLT